MGWAEGRRVGWIALTVYAVSMAFVEAACVINLKQLYVPGPWNPPFPPLPAAGLRLEQAREIATLVMIVAIAALGRPPLRILIARGLWVFGLWILFYYAFLRIVTGFPRSLADPDLVFLVPRPWIAPVWFACLVSTLCAVLARILSRTRGG